MEAGRGSCSKIPNIYQVYLKRYAALLPIRHAMAQAMQKIFALKNEFIEMAENT
jgi:hypothetical protein